MNINNLTIIDLFCGIGGFRLGLELGFKQFLQEQSETIQPELNFALACEINEACRSVYAKNFLAVDPHPVAHDIMRLHGSVLPGCDIMVGGFPCQPFSEAGKRFGFKDPSGRGNLFFEMCRLISETPSSMQPKVLVFENVRGLLKHDGGQTFKVILEAIDELGYHASWALLNSNQFGSPQNRERVFIVAIKKTPSATQFNFKQLRTQQQVSLDMTLDFSPASQRKPINKSLYTLLGSSEIKRQPRSGLIFSGYMKGKKFRSMAAGDNRAFNLASNSWHQTQNCIYSTEGCCQTITSQACGRFRVSHSGSVYQLTSRDCYQIMGFPGWFVAHPSVTVAYKQIGNSVDVRVVAELARCVFGHLNFK